MSAYPLSSLSISRFVLVSILGIDIERPRFVAVNDFLFRVGSGVPFLEAEALLEFVIRLLMISISPGVRRDGRVRLLPVLGLTSFGSKSCRINQCPELTFT